MAEQIIKYTDIDPGTFDIISCEHKDLFWKLIGHTAGIYRDPLTGMTLCFESTSISRISGIKGVQLNPFGLWLDNYPGKVYLRRCRLSPDFIFKGQPEDFIHKYRGSSYPNTKTRTGRWKLILSALDVPFFGEDLASYYGADTGIFCTELIVMWLRWCGIMNGYGPPAAEWEPDDVRGSKIDKHLKSNVIYEKEIRIK